MSRSTRGKSVEFEGSGPRTRNYLQYDEPKIPLGGSKTCRAGLFLATSKDVGERGLFTEENILQGEWIGSYGDVFALPSVFASLPEGSDLQRYVMVTEKKPEATTANCLAIPMAQIAGVQMPPREDYAVMQFANSLPYKAGRSDNATNNMIHRLIKTGLVQSAEGADAGEPLWTIGMFAARDILPLEELFWYYGPEADVKAWPAQLSLPEEMRGENGDRFFARSFLDGFTVRCNSLVEAEWAASERSRTLSERELENFKMAEWTRFLRLQTFARGTLLPSLEAVREAVRVRSRGEIQLKHLNMGTLELPKVPAFSETSLAEQARTLSVDPSKYSSAIAPWRQAQKDFLREKREQQEREAARRGAASSSS